jgi:predicted permease
MRLALGASRARIIRQLLTESFLLAALAGAAGFLLSFWGSHATWTIVEGLVRIMFLADRPFVASFTPDVRILGFTIALSLATGLLFGVAPALKISRSDVSQALKEEGITGGGHRLSQSWLVGGQMAISMMFLVCAALLLQGLARSRTLETGFDTSRVFIVWMNFGNDPAHAASTQQRIVEALAQSPDIQRVALTDRFPFAGTWSPPVIVDDPSSPAGKRTMRTLANYVSPAYFDTMGIRIERGRAFAAGDAQTATAAIVSESAARRLWANDDPLGRRLTLDTDFRGHFAEFEVVGVARDASTANVSRPDPAYVYLSTRAGSAYNLLLRSNADIAGVVSATTQAIKTVEGRVPTDLRVMRLRDSPFMRVQLALPAIIAPFVVALALVALLLAGIGIYGVTSYITSRRTREIGIRMALGAVAGSVQWMIVRQALVPVALGAAFGLLGAAALSQVLQSTLVMPSSPDLLFGVSALDPTAFIGTFAFAMMVAGAASYIPARRATTFDPLTALRCE